MIIEGKIKDAKMSSCSSDFQTLMCNQKPIPKFDYSNTLNINFLCIFFMNYKKKIHTLKCV